MSKPLCGVGAVVREGTRLKLSSARLVCNRGTWCCVTRCGLGAPRLSDDGERGAVSRVVAWVPPKRLDALAVGARAR